MSVGHGSWFKISCSITPRNFIDFYLRKCDAVLKIFVVTYGMNVMVQK